jgi:hypothetical protein
MLSMARASYMPHVCGKVWKSIQDCGYTTCSITLRRIFMSNEVKTQEEGIPKFGKLLIVLFLAVVFCGALTWIMGTYFPNFPGA